MRARVARNLLVSDTLTQDFSLAAAHSPSLDTLANC